MQCHRCRGYGTVVVSCEDVSPDYVDVRTCDQCDGKGKLPDAVLQHYLEKYVLIKSSPNVIQFPVDRVRKKETHNAQS